jgi:hypothetical protein
MKETVKGLANDIIKNNDGKETTCVESFAKMASTWSRSKQKKNERVAIQTKAGAKAREATNQGSHLFGNGLKLKRLSRSIIFQHRGYNANPLFKQQSKRE